MILKLIQFVKQGWYCIFSPNPLSNYPKKENSSITRSFLAGKVLFTK
ncbi:hypothetical protein EDF66_1371 [Sphingobacterium sp. JUb20]|nr:hypothetical protein [Sphingobacterium sp. JUb21]TCQ95023.1 hypothetical protein EDF66_1371 [Sphingobacterium sp. JUb20]